MHRDVLSGVMPLEVEPGISGAGAANADCANLIAPVHIGEGTMIARAAKVGPNVVLGKNCRIAANAEIKDSVFWDDVVVEKSRSIIGANARIGKGSVIGHDVRIDPDTVAPEGSRIGPSAPIGAR